MKRYVYYLQVAFKGPLYFSFPIKLFEHRAQDTKAAKNTLSHFILSVITFLQEH